MNEYCDYEFLDDSEDYCYDYEYLEQDRRKRMVIENRVWLWLNYFRIPKLKASKTMTTISTRNGFVEGFRRLRLSTSFGFWNGLSQNKNFIVTFTLKLLVKIFKRHFKGIRCLWTCPRRSIRNHIAARQVENCIWINFCQYDKLQKKIRLIS
jgi:hypothetical protein